MDGEFLLRFMLYTGFQNEKLFFTIKRAVILNLSQLFLDYAIEIKSIVFIKF